VKNGVGDEECREYIDGIVQVTEEYGSGENEGDDDGYKADRFNIPKDEGDEKWEASMPREEKITAKIEDTKNIIWIERSMRGKWREVSESDENGSDEDE